MQALVRKLFWLSFWVVGFAVSMTGLLLHFKYQAVFTGLQRDRMLMVAREIDDIAEKDLSLGQDFWGIATLQEVLDRRRGAEASFAGIDIAGGDGRIAYATDPARIGSSLPPDWLAKFAARAGVSSLSPAADVAVVALPIRNSFDQLAGYTVIRYGRAQEHEAMARFRGDLLRTGSLVFVVFTLLLFGVLLALRRRMEHALAQAQAAAEGKGGEPHLLAEEMDLVERQLAEAGRCIAALRPEGAPRA